MFLLGDFSPAAIFGIFFGVLIGMTMHEFAHNYVAHIMGDPTPSQRGALTLNPLVHINPTGFLMFLIIGFGPLGQAYINHRNMRNPRWGYLAAVAAGPFANLLVAIAAAIVWRMLGFDIWDYVTDSILAVSLYFFIAFNILMFIFNLLPLFPLDGWSIVLSLLPPEHAYTWQRNAQNTQMIFLAVILLSFTNIPGIDPLGLVIFEPLQAIRRLLIGF